MKPTSALTILRTVTRTQPRLLLLLGLTLGLVLLADPPAGASDMYSNIGPAPQLPHGALIERYPIANYQLDQYFPLISVGVFSGVDASGLIPMIAYFIAQILWLDTLFLAYAVITVFAFAFNLDLVNGNRTGGSGALTPVSSAIQNLYTHTFGAPWLVAAIVLAGCWAMWKTLVQRRYTETAGALAVSLFYCVLAIGIVTQPQRTIAPASKLSNQLSTAILSLTSEGSITSERQAKTTVSNRLFSMLVLDPWTVLEFGGIEHCTTGPNSTRSVPVRPLAASASQDARFAGQLETASEVNAPGKTCVNNRNKYASHFLAYPFQGKERNSEHDALEKGDTGKLPETDLSKNTNTYTLGKADEPAAEAMGKGGQYQRLLLSIVILAGEIGAFLLLGSLALGVVIAQILLLLMLCFAPVALLIGIFPGRGHDYFRSWLTKLAGFLTRKVIYSLILAVTLAVSQALADATSNLGWLLAFLLQAAFLWTVFIQRKSLTSDLLAATAGHGAASQGVGHLQSLYYATRLSQITRRHTPAPSLTAPKRSSPNGKEANVTDPSSSVPPTGADVPEPGEECDEPIASTEGADIPPAALTPDPDEEPS
jgi:hypothetical protein